VCSNKRQHIKATCGGEIQEQGYSLTVQDFISNDEEVSIELNGQQVCSEME